MLAQKRDCDLQIETIKFFRHVLFTPRSLTKQRRRASAAQLGNRTLPLLPSSRRLRGQIGTEDMQSVHSKQDAIARLH